MNTLPNIPMLGSNGAGETAYKRFHEAMKRISQDKKTALDTKYPAEFEESTELPEWADELDSQRRGDSWVGSAIIILTLTCAGMGAVAYMVSKLQGL